MQYLHYYRFIENIILAKLVRYEKAIQNHFLYQFK